MLATVLAARCCCCCADKNVSTDSVSSARLCLLSAGTCDGEMGCVTEGGAGLIFASSVSVIHSFKVQLAPSQSRERFYAD